MKKHFVLSALTLALPQRLWWQHGGNSDGAVLPPADINGSQTARSSNPSTQQTGNAPQQPGGNTQQAGNIQQNPQQPGNNNQNNQPNNSALTIAPRSGELTGATYTLTTGILGTPVARNIRDQSNLSVGQIKLPTFAASEHKGGLLIFNNINGKEDLSYNSFQVSDNSYRYIQFGNFNLTRMMNACFRARQRNHTNARAAAAPLTAATAS